jgi:molybdate transport system ATP-binding protein
VTRRSALALGLRPGLAVHAVVKSVAIAQADIGGPADVPEAPVTPQD